VFEEQGAKCLKVAILPGGTSTKKSRPRDGKGWVAISGAYGDSGKDVSVG
jgi:hypothetical protein